MNQMIKLGLSLSKNHKFALISYLLSVRKSRFLAENIWLFSQARRKKIVFPPLTDCILLYVQKIFHFTYYEKL